MAKHSNQCFASACVLHSAAKQLENKPIIIIFLTKICAPLLYSIGKYGDIFT